MLKSCASDEQQLLVENTTLLLRLSDEGVQEPEHLLLDPHDRRGLNAALAKTYCLDTHGSAFIFPCRENQFLQEPSRKLVESFTVQDSTAHASLYDPWYLSRCLLMAAVIGIDDAVIDPDTPASANNFKWCYS
jgi:hypothetical protein